MELELKKLEDLSEAIVNDFAYMRAREEQMRDTNGEKLLVTHMWHHGLIQGVQVVSLDELGIQHDKTPFFENTARLNFSLICLVLIENS